MKLETFDKTMKLWVSITTASLTLALIFDWLDEIERQEHCGGYIP